MQKLELLDFFYRNSFEESEWLARDPEEDLLAVLTEEDQSELNKMKLDPTIGHVTYTDMDDYSHGPEVETAAVVSYPVT